MTQLPQKTYEILRQVFDVLGLTAEEQKEYEEKFEQMWMTRFAAAIVKKLPANEGKIVSELANKVATETERQQLTEKLREWLNPEETQRLLQKVGDEVFSEFLPVAYGVATDEQKKQLEGLFPKMALQS
jgi:hypothetical protein